MSSKTTIYDIAREAGVSTATVTRVVRKDPHVKEATRLKVQQVIDAHAYTPSVSAQNLEGGGSRTLAVVLPVVSNGSLTRPTGKPEETDTASASSRPWKTRPFPLRLSVNCSAAAWTASCLREASGLRTGAT